MKFAPTDGAAVEVNAHRQDSLVALRVTDIQIILVVLEPGDPIHNRTL